MNYWKHLPKNKCDEIIMEAGNYACQNKLLDEAVPKLQFWSRSRQKTQFCRALA
jgi:hypothetical protein